MVDYCANPTCSKPLHYLNEGRIYFFELREHTAIPFSKLGKIARRREHFWLCGPCSQILSVEKTGESSVHLVAKRMQRGPTAVSVHFDKLAS